MAASAPYATGGTVDGTFTLHGEHGCDYVHLPTAAPVAHCPDLLDHSQIGEADNLRGRVVRAFFWLMRLWPS